MRSTILSDFPSASAIEYRQGQLFVFGDDATHLLVTDTLFRTIQKTRFLADTAYRIPKETKPDIEAATLNAAGTELLAFGSWSAAARQRYYRFPLPLTRTFRAERYVLPPLEEVPEWNIEGAAVFGNGFLLSNRANTTSRVNHLVLLPRNNPSAGTGLTRIKVNLPSTPLIAGLSGLFYDPSKDLLLFTASEEDTPNAVQDGTIGNSYLGWITKFASRTRDTAVTPDGWINLSRSHPAFAGQKIESVCLGRTEGEELTLYLAADNDNGMSKLFRVALRF